MHEVVKRLKTIMLQSNVIIYQQQNDNDVYNQIQSENPTSKNGENLSDLELSQMIQNPYNINTNEIKSTSSANYQPQSDYNNLASKEESILISTDEPILDENISSD